MALIPPQNPLNLLRHKERLQAARRRQRILIAAAAVYDQERAGRGRRTRTFLSNFGHYEPLMAELMKESRGDFKAYLRMQQEMFLEILAA